MSAVGLVAGVVSAFFAIGIAVGVIGVVALGAVRGHRKASRPARPGRDDDEDDVPPRWPARLDGLAAHGG